MTRRPLIIVGFVALLAVREDFEPDSVILIDEPDVIRKRDLRTAMSGVRMLREFVEWPYQLPGSADEFFNLRPDLNPTGVLPLLEYGTVFAARLAERYGTPGAGLGAAQIMRDKALLRQVTAAAGVRNPVSRPVASPGDVGEFMAEHPGAVVLKPSNRQASLGTKVLHQVDEVAAAWHECQEQDEGSLMPDRTMPVHMLVEQYVRGHEYSVEMLMQDGTPLFTNITDKVLFPGSRPIEQGHMLPADLPAELAVRLRERTIDVLRAVGFGTGIAHCEWIVDSDEPCLVECAGRFPGDGIPELIERAYPVELAQAYFAVMRGEQVQPLPERAEQAAAVRFLQVPAGEIVSVDGVEDATALPGVVRASIQLTAGQVLGELRSSWDRAGSVITLGDTPGEAMGIAEAALDKITVQVRPLAESPH